MATRQNLIDTYNANPTLQSRYTLPQYLDLFGFGATTTPTTTTTTTPTQTPAKPGIPNIINQNVPQDRGPDNFGGRGIGKFGNLDPSTKKTVYRDVYNAELGFAIPQPIEVAATAGGIFKDIETGKNVYHGGIDVKPVFASVMEGLGFGDKVNVDDETGFYDGEIMGTFNNPAFQGLGFFEKIKADNKRNKELRDLQKRIEAEKAAKAAAAAAQAQASFRNIASGDMGGGTPGGGGGNVRTTGGDVYGGAAYGYNEAAEKSDFYKDGGRVYLYNRLK